MSYYLLSGSTRTAISLDLDHPIGKGGEGIIAPIHRDSARVVKLAHPPSGKGKQRRALWQTKVQTLVGLPPPALERCALPTQVVVDTAGDICGVAMPRLAGWPLHRLLNLAARRQHDLRHQWGDLLAIAANLAELVQHIHQAGFVIGDLNESAFLVDDQGQVGAVDCDSWQFAHHGTVYPCTVAKADYLAPELQGMDLRTTPRSHSHDAFALAVLLFQLLLQRHPYQGTDDLSLTAAIARGQGFPAQADLQAWIPRTTMPPAIADGFVKAFAADPRLRPSAADWARRLRSAQQQLRHCDQHGEHSFAGHLTSCPWCELLEREGRAWFISGSSSVRQGRVHSALPALVATARLSQNPLRVPPPPADLTALDQELTRVERQLKHWYEQQQSWQQRINALRRHYQRGLQRLTSSEHEALDALTDLSGEPALESMLAWKASLQDWRQAEQRQRRRVLRRRLITTALATAAAGALVVLVPAAPWLAGLPLLLSLAICLHRPQPAPQQLYGRAITPALRQQLGPLTRPGSWADPPSQVPHQSPPPTAALNTLITLAQALEDLERKHGPIPNPAPIRRRLDRHQAALRQIHNLAAKSQHRQQLNARHQAQSTLEQLWRKELQLRKLLHEYTTLHIPHRDLTTLALAEGIRNRQQRIHTLRQRVQHRCKDAAIP